MGRCGWESSDQFLVDFLLLHSHKSKHLVLFSTSSTLPFTHYFLCCRLILPSTLNFILSVAVTLSPFPSLPSLGSSVVAAVLRTDPLCTPHPQGEVGKVVQERHPCLCCLWVRCHHSSGRAPFYRLLRHPPTRAEFWGSPCRMENLQWQRPELIRDPPSAPPPPPVVQKAGGALHAGVSEL